MQKGAPAAGLFALVTDGRGMWVATVTQSVLSTSLGAVCGHAGGRHDLGGFAIPEVRPWKLDEGYSVRQGSVSASE